MAFDSYSIKMGCVLDVVSWLLALGGSLGWAHRESEETITGDSLRTAHSDGYYSNNDNRV